MDVKAEPLEKLRMRTTTKARAFPHSVRPRSVAHTASPLASPIA
jgi:hypothetical protein